MQHGETQISKQAANREEREHFPKDVGLSTGVGFEMASVDCEWWTVTRGEKIEDAGSGLEYGIETFGGAEGCQGKIFHFL